MCRLWDKIFMGHQLHSPKDNDGDDLRRLRLRPITMKDLIKVERHIMSAISDFAAKQNVFNDRMDAAVTGLQGDVKTLNDLIAALQASQGSVTPEDQKLLDDIEARSSVIADKLDALDALTPPAPPTA